MAFEGVSEEYQIKLLSTVRAVRKEELADEFQKMGLNRRLTRTQNLSLKRPKKEKQKNSDYFREDFSRQYLMLRCDC